MAQQPIRLQSEFSSRVHTSTVRLSLQEVLRRTYDMPTSPQTFYMYNYKLIITLLSDPSPCIIPTA
jgi:hypothetical protein